MAEKDKEERIEETLELVNKADKERKSNKDKSYVEKDSDAVIRLGKEPNKDIETIPTGSLSLDAALGVGGIPRGRVVEVFGKESSGKTTLALHMLAETQKQNGVTAFVDVEHALDPKYAGDIGVDIDELLFTQPNYGEEALQIVEELIRSGNVDMVVVDSVSALAPIAELEDDMDEAQVGLQARLMSKAMRKITGAISQHKTTVVFLNQIRSKINSGYGKRTTTSGGRALSFYSSVRINIYINKTLTNSDGQRIGINTHAKVVKNKVAPPFREGVFDIMYGKGIVRERELLNLGVEYGVIDRSSAWYSHNDDTLGQGKRKAVKYLLDNPEVANKIETRIREEMNLMNKQAKTEEEK